MRVNWKSLRLIALVSFSDSCPEINDSGPINSLFWTCYKELWPLITVCECQNDFEALQEALKNWVLCSHHVGITKRFGNKIVCSFAMWNKNTVQWLKITYQIKRILNGPFACRVNPIRCKESSKCPGH